MEYDDPDDQYAMSLGEVAKALGISRARVWQIEKAAMEKLRKRLIKAGITKDLCKNFPWRASAGEELNLIEQENQH